MLLYNIYIYIALSIYLNDINDMSDVCLCYQSESYDKNRNKIIIEIELYLYTKI